MAAQSFPTRKGKGRKGPDPETRLFRDYFDRDVRGLRLRRFLVVRRRGAGNIAIIENDLPPRLLTVWFRCTAQDGRNFRSWNFDRRDCLGAPQYGAAASRYPGIRATVIGNREQWRAG